ncbi:isoprenylcysteine carboxylmethyltransferase family protein [bacterium]|nr:isoprenylcysteine carboxylmethyltransferase family protein [bacterium]
MSAAAGSESSTARANWLTLREVGCNIVLALLFLQFAAMQVRSLMDVVRLSTALVLFKVSLDVFFYLTRRLPKGVSFSPYDWCVAVTGTFAILLFRPTSGNDVLLGTALQIGGLVLQSGAMLSLRRSIGIVPANRGIQTGGLYRFVRHPMYLSYVVAFLGYVINHPSTFNLTVYASAVLLWCLRIFAEERFLLQDAGYREFAGRVRYRLLPGIF